MYKLVYDVHSDYYDTNTLTRISKTPTRVEKPQAVLQPRKQYMDNLFPPELGPFETLVGYTTTHNQTDNTPAYMSFEQWGYGQRANQVKIHDSNMPGRTTKQTTPLLQTTLWNTSESDCLASLHLSVPSVLIGEWMDRHSNKFIHRMGFSPVVGAVTNDNKNRLFFKPDGWGSQAPFNHVLHRESGQLMQYYEVAGIPYRPQTNEDYWYPINLKYSGFKVEADSDIENILALDFPPTMTLETYHTLLNREPAGRPQEFTGHKGLTTTHLKHSIWDKYNEARGVEIDIWRSSRPSFDIPGSISTQVVNSNALGYSYTNMDHTGEVDEPDTFKQNPYGVDGVYTAGVGYKDKPKFPYFPHHVHTPASNPFWWRDASEWRDICRSQDMEIMPFCSPLERRTRPVTYRYWDSKFSTAVFGGHYFGCVTTGVKDATTDYMADFSHYRKFLADYSFDSETILSWRESFGLHPIPDAQYPHGYVDWHNEVSRLHYSVSLPNKKPLYGEGADPVLTRLAEKGEYYGNEPILLGYYRTTYNTNVNWLTEYIDAAPPYQSLQGGAYVDFTPNPFQNVRYAPKMYPYDDLHKNEEYQNRKSDAFVAIDITYDDATKSRLGTEWGFQPGMGDGPLQNATASMAYDTPAYNGQPPFSFNYDVPTSGVNKRTVDMVYKNDPGPHTTYNVYTSGPKMTMSAKRDAHFTTNLSNRMAVKDFYHTFFNTKTGEAGIPISQAFFEDKNDTYQLSHRVQAPNGDLSSYVTSDVGSDFTQIIDHVNGLSDDSVSQLTQYFSKETYGLVEELEALHGPYGQVLADYKHQAFEMVSDFVQQALDEAKKYVEQNMQALKEDLKLQLQSILTEAAKKLRNKFPQYVQAAKENAKRIADKLYRVKPDGVVKVSMEDIKKIAEREGEEMASMRGTTAFVDRATSIMADPGVVNTSTMSENAINNMWKEWQQTSLKTEFEGGVDALFEDLVKNGPFARGTFDPSPPNLNPTVPRPPNAFPFPEEILTNTTTITVGTFDGIIEGSGREIGSAETIFRNLATKLESAGKEIADKVFTRVASCMSVITEMTLADMMWYAAPIILVDLVAGYFEKKAERAAEKARKLAQEKQAFAKREQKQELFFDTVIPFKDSVARELRELQNEFERMKVLPENTVYGTKDTKISSATSNRKRWVWDYMTPERGTGSGADYIGPKQDATAGKWFKGVPFHTLTVLIVRNIVSLAFVEESWLEGSMGGDFDIDIEANTARDAQIRILKTCELIRQLKVIDKGMHAPMWKDKTEDAWMNYHFPLNSMIVEGSSIPHMTPIPVTCPDDFYKRDDFNTNYTNQFVASARNVDAIHTIAGNTTTNGLSPYFDWYFKQAVEYTTNRYGACPQIVVKPTADGMFNVVIPVPVFVGTRSPTYFVSSEDPYFAWPTLALKGGSMQAILTRELGELGTPHTYEVQREGLNVSQMVNMAGRFAVGTTNSTNRYLLGVNKPSASQAFANLTVHATQRVPNNRLQEYVTFAKPKTTTTEVAVTKDDSHTLLVNEPDSGIILDYTAYNGDDMWFYGYTDLSFVRGPTYAMKKDVRLPVSENMLYGVIHMASSPIIPSYTEQGTIPTNMENYLFYGAQLYWRTFPINETWSVTVMGLPAWAAYDTPVIDPFAKGGKWGFAAASSVQNHTPIDLAVVDITDGTSSSVTLIQAGSSIPTSSLTKNHEYYITTYAEITSKTTPSAFGVGVHYAIPGLPFHDRLSTVDKWAGAFLGTAYTSYSGFDLIFLQRRLKQGRNRRSIQFGLDMTDVNIDVYDNPQAWDDEVARQLNERLNAVKKYTTDPCYALLNYFIDHQFPIIQSADTDTLDNVCTVLLDLITIQKPTTSGQVVVRPFTLNEQIGLYTTFKDGISQYAKLAENMGKSYDHDDPNNYPQGVAPYEECPFGSNADTGPPTGMDGGVVYARYIRIENYDDKMKVVFLNQEPETTQGSAYLQSCYDMSRDFDEPVIDRINKILNNFMNELDARDEDKTDAFKREGAYHAAEMVRRLRYSSNRKEAAIYTEKALNDVAEWVENNFSEQDVQAINHEAGNDPSFFKKLTTMVRLLPTIEGRKRIVSSTFVMPTEHQFYCQAATDVYSDARPSLTGLVGKIPRKYFYLENESGTDYSTYWFPDEGEVVLAFRGTSPDKDMFKSLCAGDETCKDIKEASILGKITQGFRNMTKIFKSDNLQTLDLVADVSLALGKHKDTARFTSAVERARMLLSTYEMKKLTITGHSLGGTLATHAYQNVFDSNVFVECVVFNPGQGLDQSYMDNVKTPSKARWAKHYTTYHCMGNGGLTTRDPVSIFSCGVGNNYALVTETGFLQAHGTDNFKRPHVYPTSEQPEFEIKKIKF